MIQYSFIRLLICLLVFCFSLYLYIDKHNEITELRLQIPPISDEVRELEQTQKRLLFQKASFENPSHLMELLRKPEFSYLKKPSLDNVYYLTP